MPMAEMHGNGGRAPEWGERSREQLERLFEGCYAGWGEGVNMDGPDSGFKKTPMTPMELEARYVATEVGVNIYELGNAAAFAPIRVYECIQKFLGPLFEVQQAELQRLRGLIDTPMTADFLEAVRLEAAHQQERWGSEYDAGKTAQDWFWLLGFLAGKSVAAANAGDIEKALHHTISSAAVLLNWHRALTGEMTSMRPGIEPPAADSTEGEESENG